MVGGWDGLAVTSGLHMREDSLYELPQSQISISTVAESTVNSHRGSDDEQLYNSQMTIAVVPHLSPPLPHFPSGGGTPRKETGMLRGGRCVCVCT